MGPHGAAQKSRHSLWPLPGMSVLHPGKFYQLQMKIIVFLKASQLLVLVYSQGGYFPGLELLGGLLIPQTHDTEVWLHKNFSREPGQAIQIVSGRQSQILGPPRAGSFVGSFFNLQLQCRAPVALYPGSRDRTIYVTVL